MVHIIDTISKEVQQKKAEILRQNSLESVLLKYLENKYFKKPVGQLTLTAFQAEEKIAAWGYVDSTQVGKEIQSELQIILGKKEIKPGMHYSTKPVLLAGFILASKRFSDNTLDTLKGKALENLNTFGLFEQFLIISALGEDYENLYSGEIENESIQNLFTLYALKTIAPKSMSNDINEIRNIIVNRVGTLLTSATFSYKEIFLFEFFVSNEMKHSFKYDEHDAISLIRQILNNFSYAVSKIIKDRRKDHIEFIISDEYDVQDVLYVMLYPLFPDLTPEDYTVKHAGSNKRIDLVINSKHITIEVKMLKEKESEGKFIEELNVDISTYHKYPDIEYLFGFVYDPFHKINNPSKFYQLNGKKSNNEVSYEVEIIINPK